MPIGTTVIELRELKKKKKKKNNNINKMGKLFLAIIFTFGVFLTEIFCMMFSFHTLSAIKSLKVETERRTEFSNVWGETKTIYTRYYRTL